MYRGITKDNMCEWCGVEAETTLHVLTLLRDCEAARQFWDQVDSSRCDEEFFAAELCPWLEVNLRNTSDKIGQFLSWSCFFAFSIWGLWLHRNKRIFKQLGAGVCNVGGVMNVDLDLDYYFSAGRIKPSKEKIPVHVKWNKPGLNWLCSWESGAGRRWRTYPPS